MGRLPNLWLLLLPVISAGPAACGCCTPRAFREGGYSLSWDRDTGVVRGAEPVRLDRGRPRACLLLHGWISSPADFGVLPQALDEGGWDVYAPLHPGHGTRPVELEGVTAEEILDGARQNYQELLERYDQVAIVGHSLGGTVATILAAERPPTRLVLVAPFFDVTYKWYYVLPPRLWASLISPFVHHLGGAPEMRRLPMGERGGGPLVYGAVPTSALAILLDIRRLALEKTIPERLTMPVRLIYSASDDRSSPAAIERFYRRIPGGSKSILSLTGSSHYIFHDSEGGRVIRSIGGFLADPGPTR